MDTFIKNKLGEKLDVSIDGKPLQKANKIIFLVHGFGTDKHERGVFDDISERLTNKDKNLAIVRFSFAGFGKSEGDQKTKSIDTEALDIESVYKDIERQIQETPPSIIVLSFSNGVKSLTKFLASEHYKILPQRVIIVNPSPFDFAKDLKSLFQRRGGANIDRNGIWHLKRGDGTVTSISPKFWESLNEKEAIENIRKVSQKFSVVMIRATDDDVIKADTKEIYNPYIKNIIELPGDHNYSKPEDRMKFLNELEELCIKKV